jgi:hypothetical protein
MNSVHLATNDDGIVSDNETSPLLAPAQTAAPASVQIGRRHSTSWVNTFFFVKI